MNDNSHCNESAMNLVTLINLVHFKVTVSRVVHPSSNVVSLPLCFDLFNQLLECDSWCTGNLIAKVRSMLSDQLVRYVASCLVSRWYTLSSMKLMSFYHQQKRTYIIDSWSLSCDISQVMSSYWLAGSANHVVKVTVSHIDLESGTTSTSAQFRLIEKID